MVATLIGPYIALWRWLGGQRPGAEDFTYHRRSMLSALLVVVIFSLPVELLLVEILLPWFWLQIAVAVVAVLSTLWVLGLVLATRTLPHVVGPTALALRYGTLVEAIIPYATIESVAAAAQRSPTPEGLHVDAAARTATIATGGRTDVTLLLRSPIHIRDGSRLRGPVDELNLAVDEPARFVEAVQAAAATIGE